MPLQNPGDVPGSPYQRPQPPPPPAPAPAPKPSGYSSGQTAPYQSQPQYQPASLTSFQQSSPASSASVYPQETSFTSIASSSNQAGLSQQQQQLIQAADSWIGTPYLYGGTGRGGVDCSGFTDEVYASLGINIGRDTQAQLQSGQMVGQDGNWNLDMQQIQPGDLIFYGQQGASGPNAHVVMYIGNGEIIQAAHSGTTVGVGSLFQSASSDEPFLGVRRYINGGGGGGAGGAGGAGGGSSGLQSVLPLASTLQSVLPQNNTANSILVGQQQQINGIQGVSQANYLKALADAMQGGQG
jgi:cell wall-associated NlpC family hydrolase